MSGIVFTIRQRVPKCATSPLPNLRGSRLGVPITPLPQTAGTALTTCQRGKTQLPPPNSAWDGEWAVPQVSGCPVPPSSPLTFGRAGSALLRLLVLLVLQLLGGAGPRLQLLQDGGAELPELAVPHGRALAQVVDGEKLRGAEALGERENTDVP